MYMLPESPLLFDESDRDLYVRRPDIEFWLRSAAQASGGGWLLLGAPGTGKTTMLRWLEAELRREQAPIAWVDAGAITSAAELVDLIARPLHVQEDAASDGDTHSIQRQLRALRERPRTCVIIDNLTDQQAAFDLFGRMRDLIWGTRHNIILSGRLDDVATLRRPPADAFFSHTLQLHPPDVGILQALGENVERPLPDLQRLLSLRPPSLRAAVRYLNTPSLMDGAERWRARLSGLRPAAAGVGEQVLELGRPVTAEDDELQARTGLGSIALRRYLRSLEHDGLLRVAPERTGRPGRPVLTYETDLDYERDS
jgi:hypothetical protein